MTPGMRRLSMVFAEHGDTPIRDVFAGGEKRVVPGIIATKR
ncbi:hypothetical protein [Burkholderia sp. Ac-20379]